MEDKPISFLDSETDALMKDYFSSSPGTYPLFVAVATLIVSKFSEVTVKIQKTQIAFSSQHNFAFVWLPPFKVPNRPETYIVVSFGADHEIKHSRINAAREVQPKRWIHHVLISRLEEVDETLLGWLQSSYQQARKSL